jgi:hypothetical protein
MFFGLNDVAFLAAIGRPPAVSDSDAEAYLQAVETADGNFLEAAVRTAVNDFVVGCKADGIWAAIKASCILAGARTLTGALVPLVGAAPTSFNFAAGDYNRKTGLVGDGSTKYLNSNRNNNADPQDDHHLAVRYTSIPTISLAQAFAGARINGVDSVGSKFIGINNQAGLFRSAPSVSISTTYSSASAGTSGLLGISRESSTQFVARISGQQATQNVNSGTPININLIIFAQAVANQIQNHTNARLAFYSIGESLDLALLDARVTALINAFDAAIP